MCHKSVQNPFSQEFCNATADLDQIFLIKDVLDCSQSNGGGRLVKSRLVMVRLCSPTKVQSRSDLKS